VTDVRLSEQPGVVDIIAAGRLLPVIVLAEASGARSLGAALLDGGLRCAEVTFRTDAAVAAIEAMAAQSDLVVGAGTVLREAQVDQAVDAGARFVVSPGFGPAVIRRCRERGVPVFPGVATATEIQLALESGLDTVKFFPAEQAGGTEMIKALSAPFRTVRFIPTGGVNSGNVASYLSLPSVLAVGGTWMVPADLLAAEDWAAVARITKAAVAAAATV
jgi:2-dehydro-3-deoxyphosphogluconate aldolase/(4S)-4-hydroxy-2-oxoglutarate aldolase